MKKIGPWGAWRGAAAPMAVLLSAGSTVQAQSIGDKFAGLSVSTATWSRPSAGVVASPRDLVPVDATYFAGTPVTIPGLPDGADVDAFCRAPDGSILFSTKSGFEVSGDKLGRADVVRYAPATGEITLELEGTALGLDAATDIDALGCDARGVTTLSLDASTTLGGMAVRPADVLALSANGLSMRYRAADLGIPDGADLEGYVETRGGALLMAFDRSVSLGGVAVRPSAIVGIDGPRIELVYESPDDTRIDAFGALDQILFDDGMEDPLP